MACYQTSEAVWLKGIGEFAGAKFQLRSGTNRVGSLRDNEIVIEHAAVSRRHAGITVAHSVCRVTDLNSKSGTFIDRVRVREGSLSPGQVVSFGPVSFLLTPHGEQDSDDSLIAFSSMAPAALIERGAASAPLDDGRVVVPGRWLDALSRMAVTACAEGESAQPMLELFRDGLPARGAALLAYDGKDVNVLAVAGCCDPESELHTNLVGELSTFRQKWARSSVAVETRNGTDLLVAFRASLSTVVGLAIHGYTEDHEQPAHFCECALPLFVRWVPEVEPKPQVESDQSSVLRFPTGYVVGHSQAMAKVYSQLRILLKGDVPVLVIGETGCGKEHVARTLHNSSARSDEPFLAVNCAAIPTDLLEAELFGIEQGVATGVSRREGKMVAARRGTIFLDEIGDMSPSMQAKLLRALQEKEVHPVGARFPVPLAARVVTATNANLQDLIAAGRFRADLYFRVAGFTIQVPPLRARREDIPALVDSFLRRFCGEIGKAIPGISLRALRILGEARWPGNVRELEHEMRRLAYLCPPGQPIAATMLSESLLREVPEASDDLDAESDLTLESHVGRLERRLIRLALERSGGRLVHAARMLGLSRYGLRLKMRRLRLLE